MTVKELIAKLAKFDPEMEMMIRDDIGPREINAGPGVLTITQKDEDEVGDCEGKVGHKAVYIGCGNY